MSEHHIFQRYQNHVAAAVALLQQAGRLPAGLDLAKVTVEPPRDAAHGELSSNIGLVLTKQAGMAPRALAELMGETLTADPELGIERWSVDGPGFLNLTLAQRVWAGELGVALTSGLRYGDSAIGQGQIVNVEYVSANPTGPMHVGHCRGAIVGEVLATLLEKAGFKVTREYYINDAGAQIDKLARSFHLRYREALGEDIGAIPDGLYPGEYLAEAAQDFVKEQGDQWLKVDEAVWLPAFRLFAVARMMVFIADDLKALGIHHDVFRSEREIVEDGAVERAFAELEKRGLIYTGVLEPPKGKLPDDWEPRPQTLFRSTEFGDDVDRPLRKSDGSWTYFAGDIAYHLDKIQRGFNSMIDVWGVDHGGYVKRMQSAVKAISDGKASLDVKLCQLVNLLDNGEPVKMSKRAGNFVTARDVVDRVGKDVVRFIMLTRRNDMTLDFDFAKVTEQSRDNPVFYVQYAHARAASVLRKAVDEYPGIDLTPSALAAVDLAGLTDPAELSLLRLIAGWPRLIESAADAHEPHRVAYYLSNLAAEFHGLWNKGKDEATLRFIQADEAELTLARLALVAGLKVTIAAGLAVLGVEPAEEMH
jgi:arginyl-tRNA synthetase